MKPGNVFKPAAIAAVALAVAAVVGTPGAQAQNIYETPQARNLGVPDISRGPVANQGERQYRRAERRRNRVERRARNRNRVERRERRRNRAERRARQHSFNYERNRHGRRYNRQRRGYNHFHNGFWYSAPFWTYGYYDYAPSYSYGASDWELHVEWCHDRYRSYNERRDAYKGYDGLWHRCISPYS